jgi:hypothetical protein
MKWFNRESTGRRLRREWREAGQKLVPHAALIKLGPATSVPNPDDPIWDNVAPQHTEFIIVHPLQSDPYGRTEPFGRVKIQGTAGLFRADMNEECLRWFGDWFTACADVLSLELRGGGS